MIFDILDAVDADAAVWIKSKKTGNQILGVFVRCVFELESLECGDIFESVNSRFADKGRFAFEHLKHNHAERPQVTRVGDICVGDSLGSDVLLRADQTVVPTHVTLRLVFKDRGISVLRFADLAVQVFVKDLASRKVNQLQMVMFI